jgi:hypothetical protein
MHEGNVVRLHPQAAIVGDFEAVWASWPNKAKKPIARAKYEAIINGGLKTRTLDKDSGTYVELELHASPEQILAGVKAYLSTQFDKNTYRFKDDGKFIPHLATFLNGGRWEDCL